MNKRLIALFAAVTIAFTLCGCGSIYDKEYTNGNIAQTISESTGTQMLVFNTVHNVSKEEIANGASYVSIMRQNLVNLKIALGVQN